MLTVEYLLWSLVGLLDLVNTAWTRKGSLCKYCSCLFAYISEMKLKKLVTCRSSKIVALMSFKPIKHPHY